MNRKKSRTVLVLLVVLLSAALFGGCGSSGEGVPPASGAVTGATTVGINVCTGCHTEVTADWLTSKHANAANGLDSPGSPTVGQITTCTKNCHDPNGDSANIVAAGYIGTKPRPVVGCEACHGGGSLHYGSGPIFLLANTAGTSLGSVKVSGQYVMCTSCHALLNSSGTGTVAATHDPASSVTPTGSQYTITDTHFASAGNWSGLQGANIVMNISGYAMNYARDTVCTDCHNPHKTADINREWAASGHAFRGPENPPATYNPWSHYNWTCDAAANCGAMGTYGDRTTCQRCHTTTGFAAYADALGSGNTTLANAIYTGSLPPLAYNANFKPEMLECKGCHSDNRGSLRNPRAYKARYQIPVGGFPSDYPINADVSYQYPDISASNVCMPCHTGRGSGKAIHNLNTGQTAAVNFSNLGFPDGHYLTGGGTMFKGTAYEYVGRSYFDPASYKHNRIGTPNAPNTGSNGPCIGCHMDRPGMSGNHLFEPISTNTGTIIVSSEICFNCHAGSSIDFGRVVQDEKDNFEFALEALGTELDIVSGYTFTTDYPYFFSTNWLSAGDTDTTGNTTGKNNLGAAFNMSLLHHEPGAYVHNSRYVKRLIYDSLDWIDDKQMNYSVGATLTNACSGDTPPDWCQGAMKYLLPSGSLWNGTYPDGYGIDAERP
jgi:hypothetical protein